MNALQICQQRYDNLLPDDSPEFLETSEGANWLSDAGEQLVGGHDLKIGKLTVVSAYELSDAVAAEAIRRVEDCEDEDGMLGQLLVAVANYDMAQASSCLKSLLSPYDHPVSPVNAIAEDLAQPFADLAAEQLRADAEDEAAELRFY